MKNASYLIVMALVFLTTFPLCAGDKKVEPAEEKPKTVVVGG